MINRTILYIIGSIGLSILLSRVALADPAKLTHITVSNGESTAQVAFAISQKVKYHVYTLPDPMRLVVDFTDTHLGVNVKNIATATTPIKTIRYGFPKPGLLRIVFDLNYPIQYKTETVEQKLLLELFSKNAKKITASNLSTTAPVNEPILKQPPPQKIVVVIDPGHGGKDPGAIGEHGTKEKNVVLAISRHLAEYINQQPNMRAVLTRNGDYFVPLRERLKLARKGKADLFIAIHADSYFNDRSTGASVYALSRHGATTEAARWLARRENTSELDGVDLGELEDKSYVLRSVLLDLAQTATNTDSLRLGNSLLDALDNVTRLHYNRVEQAPFVVLKSPDIPSILVETGFISNPSEEEKLRDKAYQHKVAQALFEGIKKYLKKYSAHTV